MFDQQYPTLLKLEQLKIYFIVVPIHVDFVNKVQATIIKYPITIYIKQHASNDKFKVEKYLLYLKSRCKH